MVKVLKFGGSSVASIDKIEKISNYLKDRIDNKEKLIVVVSAMGDETNKLIELAKSLNDNPNKRELDSLLSTGELKTISLMTMSLHNLGVKAISLSSAQIGIQTYGDYQNSKIENINTKLLQEKLEKYRCLIIPGFQGINKTGDITTLGRGGSDTSAVAIASVLGVDCEIYTDVEGIYSIDPRLYPKAKKLHHISYEEMNELSSLGANVMHNRSIMIAKKYNIKIYVAKTLSRKRGTYIMNKNMIEQNVITALAVEKDVLSTSIRFKSGIDLEEEIMNKLTENKINVDMISQVYFEQETNFAFTCNKSSENELKNIINNLEQDTNILGIQTKSYDKVSLVGSGMRDVYGVVSRVFKVLKAAQITFYQVTTSEISISLLVKNEQTQKAVDSLMKEFELGEQC